MKKIDFKEISAKIVATITYGLLLILTIILFLSMFTLFPILLFTILGGGM